MQSIVRMIRIFNDNYVNTLKSRNRELEKLNARLKEYHDLLEEKVKKRTQELTVANEKLRMEVKFRSHFQAGKCLQANENPERPFPCMHQVPQDPRRRGVLATI